MKQRALLLSSLFVAGLVAACAGGGADGAATATTDAEDLNILQLRCRNGERVSRTRLDISPVAGSGSQLLGTLITDEGEAFLVCTPSHVKGDAGLPNLLISCVERPGAQRTTNWTVDVVSDPTGGHRAQIGRHVFVDRGAGLSPAEEIVPAEELACSRIAAEVPVLPYSVVSGYVNRTCNVCHEGQFDSLEKIREQRDIMFGMISSGIMPKRNPGWRESDEGRLTLAFLAQSRELD